MNIGIVNIYSFRPHVQHSFFLAKLLADENHKLFFLTCDSDVTFCYPKILKNTSTIKECTKCMAGGLRSYTNRSISSVSNYAAKEPVLDEHSLYEISLSSSCTLNRTESEEEWSEQIIAQTRDKLSEPIQKVFSATCAWIKDNGIEAVICFNGRMDLPRAVTYACEKSGIPYVTHERTWFGDGLLLNPNANCLSIESVDKMVKLFRDKPLCFEQAAYAAWLVAIRFMGKNHLEWRLYNQGALDKPWPVATNLPKILVVPSSKNEFAGHSEWLTEWRDNTQALDDYMDVFNIKPEQVVIRFHPNWGENIGKVAGERSRRVYKNWCEQRNIHYIDCEDRTSTFRLITEADVVVMNGGSSAIEAGFCGKDVVCLGPSTYQNAGFVKSYLSRNDMKKQLDIDRDKVNPIDQIRMTLRFVYLRAKRHPQFTDHVIADSTTSYTYRNGASAEKIIRIFNTGTLDPDDESYASDTSAEDEIIKLVMESNWEKVAAAYKPKQNQFDKMRVERRRGLRWIDRARNLFPRGDR